MGSSLIWDGARCGFGRVALPPHEYWMRDDRHWQPPVLRSSRIPVHIRNFENKEGMVGTPTIPGLAPLLDASNTQEWEKRHRLKPVLLSPHNWAAFCSPQCYGRPSVGWRARAKAGATSTPQLECPCSLRYYKCPSVGREARAKAGSTSTPQLGGSCFLLHFRNVRDTQVWDGRHRLKPVLHPSHNWATFVLLRC